jgi:hypothetical protein
MHMSCANNLVLPVYRYGNATHILRKSLDTIGVQVKCPADRIPSWNWQSSTTLIFNLAKARFEPCMIQLFLILDTAFVLAASAAVCLYISSPIHLCTMVVLQVLRPKFCIWGELPMKRKDKQLHVKTTLEAASPPYHLGFL